MSEVHATPKTWKHVSKGAIKLSRGLVDRQRKRAQAAARDSEGDKCGKESDYTYRNNF